MKALNSQHRCASPGPNRRQGQTLIFILLLVVILAFIALWQFDLHKTLRVKMLGQNGGDAAAVMAARWQGTTLNLIGDVNIMQALAISVGDAQTVAAVSNLQAHLLLFGPMIGFMASQQAAKNNGIYQNEDFTRMIREHADLVRNTYTTTVGPGGEMLFPEPYAGAWDDYADMLDQAAADGVAAAPENARFFSDYVGDHTLLQPDFYDAIAGRNWCWFYHNAPNLLQDYTDYTFWPPLPEIVYAEMINSEIFGLGVARRADAADDFVDASTLGALAATRGLSGTLTATGMLVSATWYCYGDLWGPWTAMDTEGEDPFPATGLLKPEYNYAGADAAVRVMTTMGRVTPGPGGLPVSNTVTWTAAAKPFGYLAESVPPDVAGIVLPAYRDARLIPMDASSALGSGGFDPEWRHFIEVDLPEYLATGQLNCSSRYCRQLQTWEDASFRQDGVNWLSQHSDQCTASGGGGGGGRGGGRRRGH